MSSKAYPLAKRTIFVVIGCIFVAYITIGIGIRVSGRSMIDSSHMLDVLHVSTRLALSGNQTDCTIADGYLLGNFCKAESTLRGNICGCEVVKYVRTYTFPERILNMFYSTHIVNLIAPVPEFLGSKIIAYVPRYAHENKQIYGMILESIHNPNLFLDNFQEHITTGMPPDIDTETIQHEKFYLAELKMKYKAIDVCIVVVEDDNDMDGSVVEVVSASLQ